ncbi:MAG TPA: hypothetical protein VJB91_00995 [Patescibacteria group bacterium]|nr:hypothetical protein [Patescibacteria group bacterium]
MPYTAEKLGQQFVLPTAEEPRSFWTKYLVGKTPFVMVRPSEDQPVEVHGYPQLKGEVAIQVLPHDKLKLVSSDPNIEVLTYIKGKKGAKKEVVWIGGRKDEKPKQTFVQKESFLVRDTSGEKPSLVRFRYSPLSKRS